MNTQSIERAICSGALALVLASAWGGVASAGAAPQPGSSCQDGTPVALVTSPSPTAADAAIPTQAAVAPEVNPPGDIPDNQAFVTYRSAAGGYAIDMPEGWARQESGPDVAFTQNLDTFSVAITCTSSAPTVDSANAVDVPALAAQVPAFELIAITAIDLPAGPAVLIQYRANSAPDDVTGKQVRLDVDRYDVFKDGRMATITLAVPAGSDNVDVSHQVSRSFAWTA